GTHEELLAQGAIYAQMWQLQRQQNDMEKSTAGSERQPVNLVALVAGILDATRELLQERDVNLYTLIGPEAARISGEHGALQRLIGDLYLRTLAFTPRGGRMALRLAREGPLTRLSMTDGRVGHQASVVLPPVDDPRLERAASLDPAALAAETQR